MIDITEHERLVWKISNRYQGRGVPVEDLIQEGCLGLIEAAKRFDPTRGVKFSTYASWWVRSYVLHALNSAHWPVKLPVYQAEAIRSGLSPDDPKLGDRQRARLRRAYDVAAQRPAAVVLEEVPAPTSRSDLPASVDDLRRGLRKITGQYRAVLALRYGLGGRRPKTLREISQALGCSHQRVSQLERLALGRLRRVLQA